MYVALSVKVGERMNSVKIFLVLLFTSFVFLTSCKDQGTTPPEPSIPEISGVELSAEQIIVNDTVLITVTLSEELGGEYVLKWQLSGYQTAIDSVTTETIFSWTAPRVHGNYEHSVQILSATGEPVSELYLFTTEIFSAPVVPVKGSKFVFSKPDINENHQIFTMNEDGTELKQLTFNDEGSYDPSWSPDGQRIVFNSSKQSTSLGLTLFTMDSDGSNAKILKDLGGIALYGDNPDWSPDGTRIAFYAYSGFNTDIYVYNFETDTVLALTDTPVNEYQPSWSPDGKYILFTSKRDYNHPDSSKNRQDIYKMNADGTNEQRLTENGLVSSPVWKPRATTILFRDYNKPDEKLRLLDIETNMITDIHEPFQGGYNLNPESWSHDGTRLFLTVADYPYETFHIINTSSGEITTVPIEAIEQTDADWYEY